jgi:hypothetical protein
MKKALQNSFLTAFLVFSSVLSLNAQLPPHPSEQSGGSSFDGGRIGASAGAPVGNGTFILLILAVAYATRKVYVTRSADEAES